MSRRKITFIVVWIIVLQLFNNSSIAQIDSTYTDSTSIQKDSVHVDTIKMKKKYEGERFLRIGTDVKALTFPVLFPGKSFAEFTLDYKYKDKTYAGAEIGWGKGNFDYPHLKYSTNTFYLRAGLDNSLLALRHSQDYDIVYAGFRYAMGFGNRSFATYSFDSPFGGEFVGEYDPERYFVHWGEVLFGMKVEIYPRCFLGWTGRAKFLFNKNTFETISPFYIAGYGNADRATSFDMSLYASFLIFNFKNIKK